MAALMEASPYITAYYRSGIHAFNTAWTVLIREAYSWFYFTSNIINRGWYIGSTSSRPLLEGSVRFASPTGRSISLSWLSIFTPNIINRGWYIGSTSSKPLLEGSVRFTSLTGRSSSLSWLKILTVLPYRRCVVIECNTKCKLLKVMCWESVSYIYTIVKYLATITHNRMISTLGLCDLEHSLTYQHEVFQTCFSGG